MASPCKHAAEKNEYKALALGMLRSLTTKENVRGNISSTLKTIAARWDWPLDGDDLEEYSALVGSCVRDIKKVSKLPAIIPSNAHVHKRTSYRAWGPDTEHNAWYFKTSIQLVKEGKLYGKRIAVNDTINVAGVPMMQGSKVYVDHVPNTDATVVTRILKEGAILAGKAVVEEMCMSSGSYTSASGPVRNPVDLSLMAGGASSGCAALLARGEIDMAIGGDQAGCLRIPAACCGVVGLKPTFGLVPYTGAISLAPNLDHLGPMATCVKDCALLLEVIAGNDGLDTRQRAGIEVPNYHEKLDTVINGMKIGLIKESFNASERAVTEVVRTAIDKLDMAGADVEMISMETFKDARTCFKALYYCAAYQSQFQKPGLTPSYGGYQDTQLYEHGTTHMKERFLELHPSAKFTMLVGEYLKETQGDLLHGQSINCINKIRRDYDKLLEKYDILIMPTLPVLPLPHSTDELSITDSVNLASQMSTLAEIFNLTGHPVLTINSGHIGRIPVGMTIVGRHWDDQNVLNVGFAWENIVKFDSLIGRQLSNRSRHSGDWGGSTPEIVLGDLTL